MFVGVCGAICSLTTAPAAPYPAPQVSRNFTEVFVQCYGVRFRGKVSHIDAVSGEDAKSFLEGEGSVKK